MSMFSQRPDWLPANIPLPIAESVPNNIVREEDGRRKLNSEQEAATSVLTGKTLIQAGAGCGKSTILIARMKKISRAFPDAKVLMLSFTKKSANDLRNRIGNVPNVTISTFHSLCYQILMSSGMEFSVQTSPLFQESVIRNLIGGNSGIPIDGVLKSLHKTDGIDDDIQKVRAKYLKYLQKHQTVTFDTMQIFAIEALKKNDALMKRCRKAYDFYLLEEGQDIDANQAHLMSLLTKDCQNITVVADQCQSIYAFRGASPHIMEEFAKSAINYEMKINYRCTTTILWLANQVMRQYPPLISASSDVDPIYPEYLTAMNPEDEAKKVVDQIENLHKSGEKYKDMAVLFRSSKASRTIVNELLARKIPAINKSITSLNVMQMPCSGIIKLFRFMLAPESDTFNSIMPILYLKQSLFKTVSGIRNKENLSWKDAALRLALPFFHREYMEGLLGAVESIREMAPPKAVIHLLNHGYGKYVSQNMVNVVKAFSDELEEYPSIAAYISYLDNLQEQITAMKDVAAKNTDCLQLMTIHASKGLEFSTVFLIGCYDGCLPSIRDDVDFEEERRLLYVAVTRAKKRLYISYPRMTEQNDSPNEVSRFLRDAFSI